MVNNVETDALPVNWQDVTSSSFQEQDRVNVDFDELAGNFAQSSVLTNRKLNETVGGMRMMSQGANMMTEYDIRVFVETWVEPVLRQLVKLEEAYETDQVVLGVAGQKSGYFQKFGRGAPMDALLGQELTLTVNVGMGATDPDMRLQRAMQAFGDVRADRDAGAAGLEPAGDPQDDLRARRLQGFLAPLHEGRRSPRAGEEDDGRGGIARRRRSSTSTRTA
jgi:hypothetical protein